MSEDADTNPGDEVTADSDAEGDPEADPESDADAETDPDSEREADTETDADPGVLDRLEAWVSAQSKAVLSPSARSWIGGYVIVVIAACLVVAAAGGFLTYNAQTAPETELQTQTVGTWEASTDYSHGATVTNESIVFETGERLENRPLYFTRLSPVLEGEYVVSHEGDTEGAVGVVDVRLVFQATEEIERTDPDGQTTTETVTHWRETDPIATEEIDGLAPGENKTVAFEVNATAAALRLEEIEEDLGASPGTQEVVVVADTALEAEVEGERFTEERTDRLAIDPGGGTYSVEATLEPGESYEVTETVEVPIEPSPIEVYGGPILIVVGLLAAGLVTGANYLGAFALTPLERRRLTYRRARVDHNKWISRGEAPDDDRTVVELQSLEDLVNVAIDSDRRVIESAATPPTYAVVVDDVRYVFEPPAEIAEDGDGDFEWSQPDDEASQTGDKANQPDDATSN